MGLAAGSLRNRIAIQKRGEPDALGEMTGWADIATVWANVRNLSGLQAIQADADTSTVKASIRIRRRTDVNAGMRVVLDSVNYDILAVIDDAQGHVFTDLVCQKAS